LIQFYLFAFSLALSSCAHPAKDGNAGMKSSRWQKQTDRQTVGKQTEKSQFTQEKEGFLRTQKVPCYSISVDRELAKPEVRIGISYEPTLAGKKSIDFFYGCDQQGYVDDGYLRY
jgi:hypothetical protein